MTVGSFRGESVCRLDNLTSRQVGKLYTRIHRITKGGAFGSLCFTARFGMAFRATRLGFFCTFIGYPRIQSHAALPVVPALPLEL
jgi:hypothetical protein